MSRGSRLTLLAVSAVLLVLPLSVDRPGLPSQPRGDEPTVLLAVGSLLESGDLRYREGDARRLFEVHPFAHQPSVLLTRDPAGDLWLDVAPLYPVLAMPWAALFGDHGPLVFNMLLVVLCLWLGATVLRRHNPSSDALLFVLPFTLLQTSIVYAFWLQAEVLAMTLVTTTLALGWPTSERPRGTGRAFGSGIALGAATLLQPALGWLGLAVVGRACHWRRWRFATAWLVGCGLLLLAGRGLDAWVGPGGDTTPVRVTIEHPLAPLDLPGDVTSRDLATNTPYTSDTIDASVEPVAVARQLGYLLTGRHAGFLVYFPFVLVAMAYFLRHARRARASWLLLAAAGAVVVHHAVVLARVVSTMPITAIQDPLDALLATSGNRLLVAVVPISLFVVRRLAPASWTLAGVAFSTALLGTLLVTPFGSPTADATAHAHLRGSLLRLLPFEHDWLDRLPDHASTPVAGGQLWHRRDEAEPRGDAVSTLGGIATTLWLDTDTPPDSLHLGLRQLAPRNRVEVTLGGAVERRDFTQVPDAGAREQLRFTPPGPTFVVSRVTGDRHLYRIDVDSAVGARPRWRTKSRAADYIGVELTVLGTDAYLGQDLFHVAWQDCGAPGEIAADDTVRALVELRNDSDHPWPHSGAVRVRLGHRWRSEDGTDVVTERGLRTDLDTDVAAGTTHAQWLDVLAPPRPGVYQLEIDLIFENVAWFSGRGAETCRQTVRVEPASSEPVAPEPVASEPEQPG